MPAYVTLCRFTESGAREVKSTVVRARGGDCSRRERRRQAHRVLDAGPV